VSLSPLTIEGVIRGTATEMIVGGNTTAFSGSGTFTGTGAITSAAATLALGDPSNRYRFKITLQDATGSVVLLQSPSCQYNVGGYHVLSAAGRYRGASAQPIIRYFGGSTNRVDGTYTYPIEVVFSFPAGEPSTP